MKATSETLLRADEYDWIGCLEGMSKTVQVKRFTQPFWNFISYAVYRLANTQENKTKVSEISRMFTRIEPALRGVADKDALGDILNILQSNK